MGCRDAGGRGDFGDVFEACGEANTDGHGVAREDEAVFERAESEVGAVGVFGSPRGFCEDFAWANGCVIDEGAGEDAALVGGPVDEGFEGAAGLACALDGAVETGGVEIAPADGGGDAPGAVVDDDDGALEVFGGAVWECGARFAIPEVPARVREAGRGFEIGEVRFEGSLGGVLEVGVYGGVDGEAAVFDELGIEDEVEVAADGVEGVVVLGGRFGLGHDADGLHFGGGCLGFGDGAGFDHAVEDVVALFAGGGEISDGGEPVGAADDACDHGGFCQCEGGGRFAEVGLGGEFEPVDAAAEEDAVDVEFEDLVFGEFGFDAAREHDLGELAMEGAFGHAEAVACELHGDGGGALDEASVPDIAEEGAGDADEIDTAVVAEACVLACEKRLDEVRGNLFEWDDDAVLAVEATEDIAADVVDYGALGHGAEVGEVELFRDLVVDDEKGDAGDEGNGGGDEAEGYGDAYPAGEGFELGAEPAWGCPGWGLGSARAGVRHLGDIRRETDNGKGAGEAGLLPAKRRRPPQPLFRKLASLFRRDATSRCKTLQTPA